MFALPRLRRMLAATSNPKTLANPADEDDAGLALTLHPPSLPASFACAPLGMHWPVGVQVWSGAQSAWVRHMLAQAPKAGTQA